MKLSSVAMEQFLSLALGAGARSESGERVQNRLATGTGKLRCISFIISRRMPTRKPSRMKRIDQLLTRATLFKDVWHYKFVPETNLVDVHMGRLRRKVDGANEAPMICTVRGAGFVLSAIPLARFTDQIC